MDPVQFFSSLLFSGNSPAAADSNNNPHKHTKTTAKATPTPVIPLAPVAPSIPVPVEPSIISPVVPPVRTTASSTPAPASHLTSVTAPSVASRASVATQAAVGPQSANSSRLTQSASTSAVTQDAKSATASSVSSSNHSTGVIVGVILALVLVAALGTGFWYARKRKMKERAQWRSSWKAGLYPALETKRKEWDNADPAARDNLLSEKFDDKQLPPPPSDAVISPPPSTFNNPVNFATSIHQGESVASAGMEIVHVRRGFLASLPDELPISIGDIINIVNAYDDGWCLCANTRGERGMVPVECLIRTGKQSGGVGSRGEMEYQDADHARMSHRASSLYLGVTPHDSY